MEKITINKNITIRKRPADFEHLDVTVGYSQEIEYEDEVDLKGRIADLNVFIRKEIDKEFKKCYKKYWKKEFNVGKAD